MKLSLAITTHNRPELTIKAFEKVLDDKRINEIVIVDDCSNSANVEKLQNSITHKKVRTFFNEENLGMSRNKAKAISLCSNEWVIILDSDNVIDSSYIDSIEKLDLRKNVIYCPEFARPQFDYREYAGLTFTKDNAKDYVGKRTFDLIANTCNYLVYKKAYGNVYEYSDAIKESDTIYFNYLWLASGGSLHIVPGMQYDHLVHNGSGWILNRKYNIRMADHLKELIRQL